MHTLNFLTFFLFFLSYWQGDVVHTTCWVGQGAQECAPGPADLPNTLTSIDKTSLTTAELKAFGIFCGLFLVKIPVYVVM